MGAHDHVYRMLKLQLHRDAAEWEDPISTLSLSEGLGVSRTPIREVLFRFMGEGIVEPSEHGGFRLYRPDAGQLRELYSWQLQMVLMCLHLLTRSAIAETLKGLQKRLADENLPATTLVPQLFQGLGKVISNREFSRQMHIANDRLVAPRRIEFILFSDLEEEARRLLQTGDSDVKKITRRRVLAYFSRRIDHAKTIADMM